MTKGSIDISLRGGTTTGMMATAAKAGGGNMSTNAAATSGSNRPRVSLSLGSSSSSSTPAASTTMKQQPAVPKGSSTMKREGSSTSRKGRGAAFAGTSSEDDDNDDEDGDDDSSRDSSSSYDSPAARNNSNRKHPRKKKQAMTTTKGGAGKKKKKQGATRRFSRESSMSSDEEDGEPGERLASSNEAKRMGFTALKKKGEAVRRSLAGKLLSDPARFDRLQRKWREADEEGYGLLDREAFVDVIYILLRQKARPSEDELAWLCQQLKTKSKQVAYREVKNVLMGDYFDGSSYMPMWATASFPPTPNPYMPMHHQQQQTIALMSAGGAPPVLASPVPYYYNLQQQSLRATTQAPLLMTPQRQVSFDASRSGRGSNRYEEDLMPPSTTKRGGPSSTSQMAFSFSPNDTQLRDDEDLMQLPLDTIKIRAPGSVHQGGGGGAWTGRSAGTTTSELITTTSNYNNQGGRRRKQQQQEVVVEDGGGGGRGGRKKGGGGRLSSTSPDKAFHLSPERRRGGGAESKEGEEQGNDQDYYRRHSQSSRRGGPWSARTWPDSDEEEDQEDRWAALPGTVGEWLRYAACPLERRNFEELIQMLDEFSYDRGLQQRGGAGGGADGVVVRLGSLLHARITFHIAST